MIELTHPHDRPPLAIESRLLAAPGVWTPDSALDEGGLGARVTPPLGWAWDGEAMAWESSAAGVVGAMARRPIERFLRRVSRERNSLPLLVTLALDESAGLRRAAALAEAEGAAGLILWDATAAGVRAAREAAPLLPILAELPCGEIVAEAEALGAAGADGLWVGAPRVGGARRLWGPAPFPLVRAALVALADQPLPRVAGAAVGGAKAARELRALGAAALALDPAWWVEPGLKEELLAALGDEG